MTDLDRQKSISDSLLQRFGTQIIRLTGDCCVLEVAVKEKDATIKELQAQVIAANDRAIEANNALLIERTKRGLVVVGEAS